MKRVLIVAILTLLLVANPAAARTSYVQAAASEASEIPPQLTSGSQVDAYLTKAHFQGYVLLVRHGQTILSKGYGQADAQRKVPNTAQTKWPMFAVEGFMVAIVVLKLQEEGKLTVQDKLCTYVQGCPQAWRGLTIQAMLDGSSTIGIYDPFSVPGTIDQTIAQCKAAPMLTTPQGVQGDSPCNRVLLSLVIEQVTHDTFETEMRRLIFQPAGMANTSLVHSAPPQGAHGYSGGIEAVPLQYGSYPLIYATPGDIQRLDDALFAGKLLTQQSMQALIAPQWKVDPKIPLWYAYGTYVAKANHWFFGSIGRSLPVKTHRVVFMAGGPDESGFGIVNTFSPDDGAIAIELFNDTGLFTGDADNLYEDHLVHLLWGA